MYVRLNITVFAIFLFISSECAFETEGRRGRVRGTKTGPKQLWSETNLDRLKKDLFINYDKYARPEEHYEATEVRFGMGILHVETDELKFTVTLHVFLRMVWTDSKLIWDPDAYDGINVARVSEHEIWQPDIYLYNGVSGGESVMRFGTPPNVLLYPNGEVLYVPPTKLTALCQFNLRYWPFDVQHCQFQFGSWIYNGNEIQMNSYNNYDHAELETDLSWSAWNISNSTAERVVKCFENCTEADSMHFNFTLVRKSGPYQAIVVTPAVVISWLILLQFWLPPQSEEKLILNGFLVVTIVTYLTYFTNQISAAGSDTPIIVLFYSGSLYVICFSMVTTTAVFSLLKFKKSQSVPWSLRRHLQGKLGKWLLLDFSLEELPGNEKDKVRIVSVSEIGNSAAFNRHVESETERCNEEIWTLVLLINRISFVLYALALLTGFALYII